MSDATFPTAGTPAPELSLPTSEETFQAAGAVIVGVSKDSGTKHAEFAEMHDRRHVLLSKCGR